jgi:hypothetical protein
MDADGALHLTAAPEEAPQGQVQLHRVAVHLGELDEEVDGLVRALIEQVVEAAQEGGIRDGPAAAAT